MLAEIQHRFADAVFAPETDTLPWVRANGWAAERRIAIYRNNTFLGLAAALRDGFPVVYRLVGEAFFDVMARQFVSLHPPRTGCLLDYGAEFAACIDDFDPARSLPYLSDVARLEWAWHEAFHAADAPVFTLRDLAAVAPEQANGLRFRLQPSARLIASAWPVLRIFHVNQPDYPGDPAVNLYRETGCRAVVLRDGPEVVVHPLSAGEFACLDSLMQDGSLARAFAAGLGAEAGFDLPAGLARLFGLNVFCHPLRPQPGIPS